MPHSIPAPPQRPWAAWAALTAVLAGALVVYQPWQGAPFDILDFSEFLPLFHRSDGFLERFLALVDYYAGQHGRLNIISCAALAAKWSLLEDVPALWQLARFAQMSLVTVGAYWLLRRLRIDPGGAVCGAMLFVVADSAMNAWVRLTMSEPLGVLFVLAAAILATRFQNSDRWRLLAWAIAAFLAGALLTKEMLVGCVPFVLALGLTFHQQGWHKPSWTPKTRWLLGATAALVGGALLAIGLVLLAVPQEGFASLYGEAVPSLHRLLRNYRRMALPANSFLPGLWVLTFPPNLLFTITSLGGLLTALARPQTRWAAIGVAGIAVTMPLMGAVLYLPWPQYHSFYGLPYLFGQALLLGFAVTVLVRENPRLRWAVYGACLMVALITGSIAQQQAERIRAGQTLNAAVAAAVLEYSAVDSIVVVVGGRASQAWQGTGATLRRYALAGQPGAQLPPGVEATCGDIGQGFQPGVVLIVNPRGSCPVAGDPLGTLVEPYRYASWRDVQLVRDSVWSTLHLLRTGENVDPANR